MVDVQMREKHDAHVAGRASNLAEVFQKNATHAWKKRIRPRTNARVDQDGRPLRPYQKGLVRPAHMFLVVEAVGIAPLKGFPIGCRNRWIHGRERHEWKSSGAVCHGCDGGVPQ